MGAKGLGLGVQGLELKASILKGPFFLRSSVQISGLGIQDSDLGDVRVISDKRCKRAIAQGCLGFKG